MSVLSPYPLGRPVTDPRLLQSRRAEIDAALEAVAGPSHEARHVIVLGEQRSGRSSVLLEVARRASADRDALIVQVDGLYEQDCRWSSFIRRLMIALVEALAGAGDAGGTPWYHAWRDRVYLRDRRPSSDEDMLLSALVLASGEDAVIDRAVLQHDLGFLIKSAGARGPGSRYLTATAAASSRRA
jgi:hypothetical protein